MTTLSSEWLDSIGLSGWLSLLLAGLVGFSVDYQRPVAKAVPAPPPPAQMIDVELAPVSADLAESEPPSATLPSPLPLPSPQAPALSEAPELVPVADAASVAFALPVEGPVRIVAAPNASCTGRRGNGAGEGGASYSGPVETLVFGKGQGAQPAPHYPWKAVKQGQEGSVGIVFSVGNDGRVVSGEVSRPCPWPLLNECALRTVLHRWRFSTGELRYYEVIIQFELEK